MIRLILSKRKLYLITSFFITILSLTIIHNFSYYDKSPYSFNKLLSYIPTSIQVVFLIKNYNMDLFSDFFNYFFKFMSLLLIIYAFFKGRNIGKHQKREEFAVFFLRIKRKNLFRNFFIEYNIELLIILLPLLIFSYIGLAIDIKSHYLYVFSRIALLYFIAIFVYFLAIFLWQQGRRISHIGSSIFFCLTIIFSYLSVSLNLNWIAYFSLLEIFRLNNFWYLGAILEFILLSVFLGIISYKIYINSDINEI